MADDHGVVAAGCDPRAELLAVGLFKVLLCRNKDIRRGIEPQKLARPLLGEVVRHDEHGLAAKAEAFGLHRGRGHGVRFPGSHFVREERISTVEYAGNRVALVLTQLNLRVHAGEGKVRAVVLARAGGVEKLVVFGGQRLTAFGVLPKPVLEGVLYDLLLLLGECGLFGIEHAALGAVSVLDPVIYAHVTQIQGVFEYLVGVHALGAVGVVGVDVISAHGAFSVNAPLAGEGRIVYLNILRRPKCGLERLVYELPDVLRLYPRCAEADVYLAGGQLLRLGSAEGIDIDAVRLVGLGNAFSLEELLAHVAGEVFVGGDVLVLARYAEDDAGQLRGYIVLAFAAEPGHIWQVHVSTLVHGDGESLSSGVRMLDRAVRLYRAAREHVCLALEPAVVVEDFERAEQVIRVVERERALVLAARNEAVFGGEGVVQLVQALLFGGNYTVAYVHGLQLYEPARAVAQLHQALYALGCGGAHVLPDHNPALAVEHVAAYEGVAVIADVRAGGHDVQGGFGLLQLALCVFAVYAPDGLVKLSRQVRALDGCDGVVLRGVLCALGGRRAEHHLRVLQKVIVDLEAVLSFADVYPLWKLGQRQLAAL